MKIGRHLPLLLLKVRSAMMHYWSSLLFEPVSHCNYDRYDCCVQHILLYHGIVLGGFRLCDCVLHMADELPNYRSEESWSAINCYKG